LPRLLHLLLNLTCSITLLLWRLLCRPRPQHTPFELLRELLVVQQACIVLQRCQQPLRITSRQLQLSSLHGTLQLFGCSSTGE
jgi:hypothetical protein